MTLQLGAVKPLLDVQPPSAHTFGPHAIKLASNAGLILDGWQADSVCALMAVDSIGRWTCREYAEWVARQNGKGAILEARILAGLFLLNEKLITYSAHEFKTSTRAFRRIRNLIRELEKGGFIDIGEVKILSGHGTESIEILKTGQEVLFIARSKGSGRGFSGECSIIDEAFGYTDSQDDAIRPSLSAQPNRQLIFMSTPPLDGVSAKVMFRIRKRALAGKSPRLGYRDWASVDPSITLDDIGKRIDGKLMIDLDDMDLVYSANPAFGVTRINGTGLDLETVQDERDGMTDEGYARERLNIWPKEVLGVGGAIDMELWKALENELSSRQGDCAIGVEISTHRQRSSIGLYGDGENKRGHMQLVNFGRGVAWIMDKMISIRKEVNPIAIGMSKTTYESLETQLRSANFKKAEIVEGKLQFNRGDILVMSSADEAAACGHMIDAIRDETLLIKPDPTAPEVLRSAATAAELREGVDNLKWQRKGTTDITPIQACTDALFAFNKAKDNLHEEGGFFGAWR